GRALRADERLDRTAEELRRLVVREDDRAVPVAYEETAADGLVHPAEPRLGLADRALGALLRAHPFGDVDEHDEQPADLVVRVDERLELNVEVQLLEARAAVDLGRHGGSLDAGPGLADPLR